MRINEIIIKNYKAFYGEQKISLPNGENLLIYGENGSGKSSLCRAINHFFDASDRRRTTLNLEKFKNIYCNNNSDISISINFKNNTTYLLTVNGFSNPDIDFIKKILPIKGFIKHKSLLPIYNPIYNSNKEKINLFRFFVEDPFAQLINPKTDKKIITEWDSHKKNLPTDFFEGIFEIAKTIESKVNEIFNTFDDKLEISFKREELKAFLYLEVKNKTNEKIISNYSEFFNEAKLVALSISIYFATIIKHYEDKLTKNNDIPKILILDDIFTGLDMGNRLPLLDVLKKKKERRFFRLSDFYVYLR